MRTLRNYLIFFLCILALTACSLFDGTASSPEDNAPPVVELRSEIIVEGRIVPKADAALFFTSPGEVTELLVSEGDQVLKGDVLARLGDRESFTAQIASAELELLSAEQALSDLQTNAPLSSSQAWLELTAAQRAYTDAAEALDEIDTDAYEDRLDDARSAVSDAEEELNDAQDEYDKYKDLASDHPNRTRAEDTLDAAQEKYDQAVRDRDRLENDLEQAKADLDMAQTRLDDALRTRDAQLAGPDPDDLALAQARLDNATAQLSAAQAALEKQDLVAPFDGTIVRIDISLGEQVLPNQAVMVIADLSGWYIETTDLSENEVVDIALGQSARFVPDALPELEMTGSVDKISDYYIEKSGTINYKVHLLIDEPDPRLRWGMTVEVTLNRNSP